MNRTRVSGEPLLYITDEEDAALLMMPLYLQVRRLEEMVSVHWPQYNWKMMRIHYEDAQIMLAEAENNERFLRHPYHASMLNWRYRLQGFLEYPEKPYTIESMAAISSGEIFRITATLTNRESTLDSDEEKDEE